MLISRLIFFFLFQITMSEPRRIQVVRPNQDIRDFTYVKPSSSATGTPVDSTRNIDYYQVGTQRLAQVHTLPLKDNWPILIGNTIAVCTSGVLGKNKG